MNLIKMTFLACPSIFLFGCAAQIHSELRFAYSIDKDGVYLGALNDSESKLIYATKNVFINKYFKFLNDSILQIGHQSNMRNGNRNREVHSKYYYRADGDSTFVTDDPPYTIRETNFNVTDSLFCINTKTEKSFLASVIDYEYGDNSTLKVVKKNFKQDGALLSESDTSFACEGTTSSIKGIEFCDFRRFYKESDTHLGKTVISENGDLIIKEGDNKRVLLKYGGKFDRKFGSGYTNPTLSSDGKKHHFSIWRDL